MAKVYILKNRGRHRKSRLSALHHLQEWLWPSMGMKRFCKWVLFRIIRFGNSAHSLALGFAFGTFASFTPFIGFHLIITFALCWLFRASYLAGVLGTLVGNPMTATPIWFSTYKVGHWLLGNEKPRKLPETINLEHLWDNLQFYLHNYIMPMALGGLVLGILAGLAFYYPLRFYIEKWRQARHDRLQAKIDSMKKAS